MLATSVLVLFGIGAVAAVILAVASRLLRVDENPLVEIVTEALPGANCGGCGYAGCEAYAAAVVLNPDVPANLCTVGGAEACATVGELSGKAAEAGEPLVAFRRCSRPEGNVQKRFTYVGANTCASAAVLDGGPFMCSSACIGLGDCVRACPFGAMYMEKGVAEIIPSKCVSCGQCVRACPHSLLQLVPRRARVMNCCGTHDKLKAVSDVCEVGCIHCGKCIKACPAKAVSFENNRIEIDHALCLQYGPSCGEACVTSCPRFILRRMGVAPLAAVSADEAENPEYPSDAPASREPAGQTGPVPAPENKTEVNP